MTTIADRVREMVRQRAQDRCEYCHRPDMIDVYSPQVDHIRAVKHGGNSEPDNLAWACFRCNNMKGSDPGSYDDITGELTPFFNPRTQVWDDHFELQDAVIVGRTAYGRVTVKILQMNVPKMVEIRRTLLDAGRWE